MPGVGLASSLSRDSASRSGSASKGSPSAVQQPYYQATYLPPSPPKSRSTTPTQVAADPPPPAQGAPRLRSSAGASGNGSSMASMTATQTHTQPVQTPTTQHWNDLPAGLVGSTAIQRKGSQQSAAESQPSIASGSKYPPAPSRSPLASTFSQSQNGGFHHDTGKDAQNGGMPNGSEYHGYVNGYGGRAPASLSPVEGTASSTFGNLYNRASDAVKLHSSTSRALPTHQASPHAAGGHARRKSIAQAVVPSISTVRFVTLCALWYTSSAVSNNTGKSILNSFRYPVTLTFIQFGFVAGWCVLFCVGRTKLAQIQQARSTPQTSSHSRSMSVAQLYSSTWGIKKPTRKALEGTVVMSVFQIAGHIFSSMATARIPVSTVHTIKVNLCC